MNRTAPQPSILGLVVALLGAPGCAREPTPTLPPTAVVDGVEHGSRLVEGEHRILQQWWRPTSREPTAVVVLLHGLKDHGARYDAFARRLVARGFAVYALDHQGHGRSEGVRGDVGGFDGALVDIDALVTHAREREGDRPVFVFGHSMGAALATLYVLDYSDIDGLVLSAGALQVDPSLSPRLVELAKRAAERHPNARVLSSPTRKFSRDPEVVRAMRRDPLIDRRKIPARTAGELLHAIETIGARAGELKLPLLALHGTGDELTPPSGSAALVDAASSSDKALLLFEGLHHDLLHEPEHEDVAEAITSWLAKRAPKAPPTPSTATATATAAATEAASARVEAPTEESP